MKTMTPSAIELAKPDTDQWHACRSLGIGASEAGAACGVDAYCSPLELFLRKRGLLDPKEETDAMKFGKLVEPVIATLYRDKTGRDLILNQPLYADAQYPFILATPDAQIVGMNGGVDFKSTNPRMLKYYGDEGTDEIPDTYVMQGQQQCRVKGWDFVEFAVLCPPSIRIYTVQRNNELIDSMIEIEIGFWARVKACDPPPADFQHARTLDLIKKMYPGIVSGKSVDLGDFGYDVWTDIEAAKNEIATAKKIKEAKEAEILASIGDAEFGVLSDGRRLRRSVVNRKEYTAKASSYVQLKEWKEKEKNKIEANSSREAIYEGR